MRSMSLLPKDSGRHGIPKRPRSTEPTPVAYALGLFGVSVAILLLPISYCAIVGGLLWWLRLHLTRHIEWLIGNDAGLISGGIYFGLALPPALLGVFLLRPIFRGHRR